MKSLIATIGILLLGFASTGISRQVYHQKSLYRDIYVTEDSSLRCMRFGLNSTVKQSCFSLRNPDGLFFNYTKMILGALYLNPNPKRVLVIGLGGASIPRAFQQMFPEISLDCVELDPAVGQIAKEYFNFQPTGRTRLVYGDARVFVKRAPREQSYDLVILDAFDHLYIPEHLLTREFLQEVRNIMSENGVLVANTFSSSKLFESESATYHAVFGDFYNLEHNNRVIIASKGKLPSLEEIKINADVVEVKLRQLGTGRDWLLPLFRNDLTWPSETKILTDQYSPSNLLNLD